MRLGLTKPGMSAAFRSPFFGFEDLQVTSDNPDDPRFTGGGGGNDGRSSRDDNDEEDDDEEEDEDEDEDEEDDDKSKSKKSTKSKNKDEDDDDDEDDSSKLRAIRQAKRYRLELRKTQGELAELKRSLEDKDKKPDEIASRDLTEARAQVTKLTETNKELTAQIAFFRANVVDWVDPGDAFTLALNSGVLDDAVDEDGNVDARELRRGLRDLAKRKPHLVKQTKDDPKARGRKSADKDEDDDDDEDDSEPRSRRSGSTLNGQRRGQKKVSDRAALAKKFPILNQM